MKIPNFVLSNGLEIPAVSFGSGECWARSCDENGAQTNCK
jgi:hypothetical protein